MKCNRCGFEAEPMPNFCPNCGLPQTAAAQPQPAPQYQQPQPAPQYQPQPAPQYQPQPAPQYQPQAQYQPPFAPSMPAVDTASATILGVLRDPLFLALCILMSVCCILSISAGSIPLIQILLTVFLWLTYAHAIKGQADAAQLRNVSGTVYASYVITYVVAGILVVCGLIVGLAFSAVMEDPAIMQEIFAELALDPETMAMVDGLFSVAGFGLLIGVFVVIAVMMIIINAFSMRYFHRFAKSVYRSIENKALKLECMKASKVWLFIVGGCSTFSALSVLLQGNMVNAMTTGCSAALYFVAGALVNKLSKAAQQVQTLEQAQIQPPPSNI